MSCPRLGCNGLVLMLVTELFVVVGDVMMQSQAIYLASLRRRRKNNIERAGDG